MIKHGKKSSPVKKKVSKEPSTREQIANLVEMQLQASQQVIKQAEIQQLHRRAKTNIGINNTSIQSIEKSQHFNEELQHLKSLNKLAY